MAPRTCGRHARRIHQNLGHPAARELVRQLRLSGASPALVQGAQQLVCRTGARSTKARASKVATPATFIDFNAVVAIDVIWLETSDSVGANIPALNVVDLASTFQQVIQLGSTKSEEAARAFAQGWMAWAGAPKFIFADLDSAFKDKLLEMADGRGIVLRCAAGQSHWQNGVCERHGHQWKQIWERVVNQQHTILEQVPETIAAVSEAKNTLRNRGNPYAPGDLIYYHRLHRPGKNKKPQSMWLGPDPSHRTTGWPEVDGADITMDAEAELHGGLPPERIDPRLENVQRREGELLRERRRRTTCRPAS